MDQFGVSRPTLREAFRVLEAESLITIRRGARGGARVHLPSIGVAGRYLGLLLQVQGITLDDVFVARVVIEPAAARMVAERRDRSLIDRLTEAVDAEEAAAGDPESFAALSTRFHALLLTESGNGTLAVLLGALDEVIVASTQHAVAKSRTTHDQHRSNLRAVHAHRKLVALIEARDAAGASTFWTKHMEALRARFLELYGATTVVELLT